MCHRSPSFDIESKHQAMYVDVRSSEYIKKTNAADMLFPKAVMVWVGQILASHRPSRPFGAIPLGWLEGHFRRGRGGNWEWGVCFKQKYLFKALTSTTNGQRRTHFGSREIDRNVNTEERFFFWRWRNLRGRSKCLLEWGSVRWLNITFRFVNICFVDRSNERAASN